MRLPFLTVRTRSADETRELGTTVGELVGPGDVLLLMGQLGAGKTTFLQGFAAGLGVPERATSPSYTLMHQYEGGRLPMLHVDLYRCGGTSDVFDLGLDEMLEAPWVVAIEWGERAAALVPDDFLEVELHPDEGSDDVRTVEFRPFGRWRDKLRTLTDALQSFGPGEV